MNIKILFFATLKDRAGLKETRLELDEGATVLVMKQRLQREFPGLGGSLESALVSVNREFAFEEDTLPAGAEVAIFPPVSGGASSTGGAGNPGGADNPGGSGLEMPTLYIIAENALDLDDLLVRITLPSTGAACIFTGMVRGVTRRGDAHDTVYLEYEAYKPMAEAKMRQVADEIRTRWPTVEGIALVQRIGRLLAGTPTVLIACTAAHRDTGVFEAARYGIDRLKEIVPIWKKEVGPGGETWVEGEYHPQRGD